MGALLPLIRLLSCRLLALCLVVTTLALAPHRLARLLAEPLLSAESVLFALS